MQRGSILVVRGGAIGDFILTLPVLSALRGQFPETRIEVLGYEHIAGLALEGGLADGVRSIEARTMAYFFAVNGELDFELSKYFASFSIIISYLYDPSEIFKENLERISQAQFIQGPHRPDEAAGVSASQCLLEPLKRLAIFEADHVPRLKVDADGSPAPRTLALHPGSGSEAKNWPASCWGELVRRLVAETDFNLLLVGGEAEGGRIEQLAGLVPEGRGRMALRLPLPQLARALRGCVGFVGHDSGISHLAAAVGLPGIVLWGETREEIWRPPSTAVKVVREEGGLAGLAVERVMQEVVKMTKEN